MAGRVIGMIGLGKMGGNFAVQAMEKGYEVIGYSRSFKEDLQNDHLVQVEDLESLCKKLPEPRVILMFLPAGDTVDKIIGEVHSWLSPGDVLVDCGNSYWGDSIRREQKIAEAGIHFIDCGTSGGLQGARHGACFMIGGNREGVKLVEPLLKDLAVNGGYVHAGKPGSGHFVKLVHNGIEFGMLQVIGEGISLLGHYRDQLDITAILKCWENGSVIRSWLIELLRKQLEEHAHIEDTPAHIEDTGEVNWLVNDAIQMEVPVPVIAESVMQLIASRDHSNVGAKAIALLRQGFGGHPLGANEKVKQERMSGQVGGFLRNEEK